MKKEIIWGIIVILLVGLFLRSYNLGEEDIWLDEGYTLRDSQQPTFNSLVESLKLRNGTPPAHFVFMHYWIMFFGTSEVALRLPSVIFGTLALIFVFLLGKELFDIITGVISAGIMALSVTHILYSQEMRSYALFSFLVLSSTFYFVRFMKNKENRYVAFFIVSSTLMIMTHYLGFIVLFIYTLLYVIVSYLTPILNNHKSSYTHISIQKWVVIHLIIGILYIPTIPVMIAQLSNLQHVLPSHLVGLGVSKIITQLGGFVFVVPLIIVAGIVGLLIVILKFSNKWQRIIFYFWQRILIILKKENFIGTILIMTLIGFVFVFFSVENLRKSFFLTRYTLFIYPISYILFSRGFTMLKCKKLRTLIVLLFVVVSMFALYEYYNDRPRKEEWHKVATFVENNALPDELIVAVNGDTLLPFNYYYMGKNPMFGFKLFPEKKDNIAELHNVKDYLSSFDGYWLIISHSKKEQGVYTNYFENNFIARETIDVNGIKLIHYI